MGTRNTYCAQYPGLVRGFEGCNFELGYTEACARAVWTRKKKLHARLHDAHVECAQARDVVIGLFYLCECAFLVF
jgi:hypothetical protein